MKLGKFQKKLKDLSTLPADTPPGRLEAEFVAEEGAEVLKVYRQAVKRQEPVDMNELVEEMGDTLISLALLANVVDVKLEDVLDIAFEKQQGRAEDDINS